MNDDPYYTSEEYKAGQIRSERGVMSGIEDWYVGECVFTAIEDGKFYKADSIRRVTITEVNGQPFDPEARYAVVADNFVLSGNDTYYTCKDARDAGAAYVNNGGGVKTRDVVSLYIRSELGGVLGAEGQPYAAPQGRITVEYNDPQPQKPSFTDVPEDAYFAAPVAWAVENGITNGTSATTFSPERTCTRGQVVTFLWRASGSPEPGGVQLGENELPISSENACPFTDVDESAYYYKAVLWAVANGVTAGTSATTFSPDKPCTRGQVVTFQWRAAGEPEPTATECPFKDVPAGAYYEKAVLWAVEKGITNGTGAATFSPDKPCTRAQVVTFLFRSAAQES